VLNLKRAINAIKTRFKKPPKEEKSTHNKLNPNYKPMTKATKARLIAVEEHAQQEGLRIGATFWFNGHRYQIKKLGNKSRIIMLMNSNRKPK